MSHKSETTIQGFKPESIDLFHSISTIQLIANIQHCNLLTVSNEFAGILAGASFDQLNYVLSIYHTIEIKNDREKKKELIIEEFKKRKEKKILDKKSGLIKQAIDKGFTEGATIINPKNYEKMYVINSPLAFKYLECWDSLFVDCKEKGGTMSGTAEVYKAGKWSPYINESMIKKECNNTEKEGFEAEQKKKAAEDINKEVDKAKKTIKADKPEMVNHPNHYNNGKMEVIEILRDQLTAEELRGFLKGNILKYVMRERFKNREEDLKKANWYSSYLNKLIEELEISVRDKDSK